MFDRRLRGVWIWLWLGIATVAPAHAGVPGAGFQLYLEGTFVSPDKTIRIEQYGKEQKDGSLLFRFWTFDGDHRHPFLLNPGESVEAAGYRSGFRFSPDSQWLIRGQKKGAGYQTLFLYHRNGYQFSPATRKPLGDLAWDFFFTTAQSKGMQRDPKDPYSLDHAFAGLIAGMEDNYTGMGQHWPDSRYVVIGLSFDMQGADVPGPWIEGWRCVYDLKTRTFSVPADFAENNAKAVKYPEPKSK